MKSIFTPWRILFFALVFGFFSRFIGLDWDSGNHLHPDERFLTMVTQALILPKNPFDILSTSVSTLNPHNIGFSFYVYGTFPLFLVKFISAFSGLSGYLQITLLGRATSGVFDLATMVLVYLISLRIFKDRLPAAFSSLFYSFLVLPIQLSHFYTVDTFLTFFLTFSYLQLIPIMRPVKNIVRNSAILGLLLGSALASKYSAVLFLPVILIGYLIGFLSHRHIREILISASIFSISLVISFRFLQPFFFSGVSTPNPKIIANLASLKSMEVVSLGFPPSIQWAAAPKIIFPALNLFWWGIGPVSSLIAVSSLLYFLRRPGRILLIPGLFWIIWLFLYNGLSFSMTARYFYPLMPLLSVFSGSGLAFLFRRLRLAVFGLILTMCLLSPVAFLFIYISPHTRVQASEWITRHLPAGSVLSCDEWDDCLPLGADADYRVVSFPVFWRDFLIDSDRIHWQTLFDDIDYLIISSNRAYASITSVPDLAPVTAGFYHELFSNRTPFRLLAEFSSRPGLPLPGLNVCFTPLSFDYGRVASGLFSCPGSGLVLIDDYAEEAYTVYDHPRVFIFQRQR